MSMAVGQEEESNAHRIFVAVLVVYLSSEFFSIECVFLMLFNCIIPSHIM